MSGAPPRTLENQISYRAGVGTDLVVEDNAPDEQVRFWVVGDAFPRILIDIGKGLVQVGNGTVPPAQLTGSAAFTFRGLYSGATNYALNDVINDAAGNSYISRAGGNINHTPTAGATDANWQLLSKAGTAGSAGSNGSNGTNAVLAAFTNLGNINAGTNPNNLAGSANTRTRYRAVATASCTITPTITANQETMLQLTQDATGGRVITWGGTINWLTDNRGAPTPPNNASDVEVYQFYADDTGAIFAFWLTDPKIVTNSIQFSTPGALVAATGLSTVPINQAWNIVAVRAYATTAPVGLPIIVDVKKNGATIFAAGGTGSPVSIASAAHDSGSITSATTKTLAAGDRLTVDIAQVGNTTAGSDLVVQITLATAVNPNVGGIEVTQQNGNTYTLVPSDAQSIVELTAPAGCHLLLPPTAGFDVNDVVDVVAIGPAFTVAAVPPGALDQPAGFTPLQFATYSFRVRGFNEWIVS